MADETLSSSRGLAALENLDSCYRDRNESVQIELIQVNEEGNSED